MWSARFAASAGRSVGVGLTLELRAERGACGAGGRGAVAFALFMLRAVVLGISVALLIAMASDLPRRKRPGPRRLRGGE
jgi:hypothetical protein